jgi:hypothetical protein
VIGGLYCYGLTNNTYVDPLAGLAVDGGDRRADRVLD